MQIASTGHSHPIASLIFTDEAIENARPIIDRARQSHGLLGDIETSGRKRRSPLRNAKESEPERKTAAGPGEGYLARLEQEHVHGKSWHERACIEGGMTLAGTPDEVINRYHDCGKFAHIHRRTLDGKLRLHRWRCKHRLCRRCGQSTALKIADNLVEAIRPHRKQMSMLTLTLKHSETPLVDQRKRLYSCFKAMRACAWWKRYVRGGVFFFQNHRSRADGLWHPHGHVIIWARYVPQWLISAEWFRITGDSANVHIEGVRDAEHAAREIARYVAAPLGKKAARNESDVAETILATEHSRLAFTFGVWPGPTLHSKRPDPDPSPEEWVAPLGETIWKAHHGDFEAAKLLAELMRSSTPETGPPTLYHHPILPPRVDFD